LEIELSQRDPPLSQNRNPKFSQQMQSEQSAMEVSWDHSASQRGKRLMAPTQMPKMTTNGELLANLIGNESDME